MSGLFEKSLNINSENCYLLKEKDLFQYDFAYPLLSLVIPFKKLHPSTLHTTLANMLASYCYST